MRWRIPPTRTLADVVSVDTDADDGPTTTITVHAHPEEIDTLVASGDPFLPGWGPASWPWCCTTTARPTGTRSMVTDSYCLLAPGEDSWLSST